MLILFVFQDWNEKFIAAFFDAMTATFLVFQ